MVLERDNFGRFFKGFIPWNKQYNEKKCKTCDNIFHYKPSQCLRKYCSKNCQYKNKEWRKIQSINTSKILLGTKRRLGKKFTKEQLINISNSLKGRKTWNKNKTGIWNKEQLVNISCTQRGIPIKQFDKFISFEPYNENFNRSFKIDIRKRDNYCCLLCKLHQEKNKEALSIHHINYDKQISIPANCCSLCRSCHAKTNHNRKQWKQFFQSLLNERYNYQYNLQGDIIIEVRK